MAADEMSDKAYAEFVISRFEEAARSPVPIVFTNRGTPHARAVLGQLVSRARFSLDVFTGCLSSAAYDASTLRVACRNLTRPVRILIGDAFPFDGPSALQQLRPEVKTGVIQIKSLHEAMAGLEALQVDHFAIADGKNIRAEDDALDRSATVILNADALPNNKLAELSVIFFEKLWGRADDWKMPESF